MPALSPTMTEGKIARWLKKEGDAVKAGQTIAEIETDKATMEVEAVDEGKLGKILIPAGAEGVAVNTPIAVLLEEGESAGDVKASKPSAQVDTKPAASAASCSLRPAAPPPSAPVAVQEKDWTGPTVTITVREALRDAM